MTKPLHLITWVLQHIGWGVSFFLFRLCGRTVIYGREHIADVKVYIFAANHSHECDPVILALIHPFLSKQFPFIFVTNPKEKYKTFGWRGYVYGGFFFKILGGYPVYSGHKDYAYALQKHVELVQEGYSIYIFPEGKRTPDGFLGPARGGLGYLASATGVPVVPISIKGLYKFSWKEFILRKRSIEIRIGMPHIYEPASTHEDFLSISAQVLDDIRKMQ